ncbi:MAG: C45 family peptidase [bacterium]
MNEPRIIEASGSRYDIGWKIGRHCADLIHDDIKNAFPDRWDKETLHKYINECWRATEKAFPELAEEVRGFADGASVSLFDMFLTLTEEVFDFSQEPKLGCTDVAAEPPATAPGVGVILGHNNDSDPEYTDKVMVIYAAPYDAPASLQVTVSGASILVGMNSNGVCLGGNQLTSSDVRAGVPRMVLARAVLDSPDIETAQGICQTENRASSYNFILADTERVIDLEGSATDMRFLGAGNDGLIWHSNHYVHQGMKEYENRNPENIPESHARFDRAGNLLKSFHGGINRDVVADILRDHDHYPDSICSHATERDKETIFSCIMEPDKRLMWFVHGQPCLDRYNPIRF